MNHLTLVSPLKQLQRWEQRLGFRTSLWLVACGMAVISLAIPVLSIPPGRLSLDTFSAFQTDHAKPLALFHLAVNWGYLAWTWQRRHQYFEAWRKAYAVPPAEEAAFLAYVERLSGRWAWVIAVFMVVMFGQPLLH